MAESDPSLPFVPPGGRADELADIPPTAAVSSFIPTGGLPVGVAFSPDGGRAYVADAGSETVSVIDTASRTVIRNPITYGDSPIGVAVAPDGAHVYVTNANSSTVAVLDTASNRVTQTIPVDFGPLVVAVTPDGAEAYVASQGSISVIYTGSSAAVATIPRSGRFGWPCPPRGTASTWLTSVRHGCR